MSLFELWLNAPSKLAIRLPLAVKLALVPWFVVSFAFAIIPDLRINVSRPIGAILAVPFLVGLCWMALGVIARMVDRLRRLVGGKS